jgi:hypothetical protein
MEVSSISASRISSTFLCLWTMRVGSFGGRWSARLQLAKGGPYRLPPSERDSVVHRIVKNADSFLFSESAFFTDSFLFSSFLRMHEGSAEVCSRGGTSVISHDPYVCRIGRGTDLPLLCLNLLVHFLACLPNRYKARPGVRLCFQADLLSTSVKILSLYGRVPPGAPSASSPVRHFARAHPHSSHPAALASRWRSRH